MMVMLPLCAATENMPTIAAVTGIGVFSRESGGAGTPDPTVSARYQFLLASDFAGALAGRFAMIGLWTHLRAKTWEGIAPAR